MGEFVGVRDPIGDGVFNMYVTDEEIVRCRDCEYADNQMPSGICDYEPCPEGKLDCSHFSRWDDYNDQPGYWLVEPDGFCKWEARRGSQCRDGSA